MLSNIGSAINQWMWNKPDLESEWNTWIAWQEKQPAKLFESCAIFKFYLEKRPNFLMADLPHSSCLTSYNKKHYVYCFGDYSFLVVAPNSSNRNITDYLEILLDIYDCCKGYTRRLLTGDPGCITILREAINKHSISQLNSHDFSQYNYPIEKLHAHCIAQFSLSTLLMRMLGDYLISIANNITLMPIEVNLCKKAFELGTFGKILEPKVTNTININQPKMRAEYQVRSWPQIENNLGLEERCSKCQRVTENCYGAHNACIDCYLKRICSKCGQKASIIGVDNLPKCSRHAE